MLPPTYIELVPKLLPFLQRRARYKVAYGGRGSGKSQTAARAIIARCLAGKERVVCAREIQKSITESVHALLKQEINVLKLQAMFEVLDTTIRCQATGSEIIFVGLRTNIESLKSLQGATIVWVEEAATVSKNSWDVLIPTVRADDSEIWITFNPNYYTDPVWQMFVAQTDSDAIVIECSYADNPWFPPVLEAERLKCLKNNPDSYDHIWLGKFKTSAADMLISPKLVELASTIPLTNERKSTGRRVIGIDPAHQGKDSTVIIHRKLDTLYNLTRYQGLDTMQSCAKIMRIVQDAKQIDGIAPIVNIDYAIGVGIGERLREEGVSCNIINFASKPYDPEKYLNKRAEMYGELAEAMQNSIQYRIPADPALINQLSNIKIDRDSSARLKLAVKDEIKKLVGRSPDEADAAALTYAVHFSPAASANQTVIIQNWA